MKTITLIALSIPLAHSTKCSAPSNDICASFVYPNGTVSQDIRIDDAGCTEVVDPKKVSGIRVYDCWCGLWRFVTSFSSMLLKAHHVLRRGNALTSSKRLHTRLMQMCSASSTAACNNGDDERVAQYNSCAGEMNGGDWNGRLTHVSCFRL
jgi:hypothetical protein